MALNHPYNPRHNPKVYVPKLTEEQRLARATPLENLRGLRFRTEAPAAPVEVPIPMASVAQAPEPQDSAAQQAVPVSPQAPAPEYVPSALEVVFAEFPELFAPTTNGQCQSPSAAADRNPDTTRNKLREETGSPPVMAYEENDPPVYSNIISFYRLPRNTATTPKAIQPRGGGLSLARSLLPHHSSG